ncbi:Enoyl-CoA hydratase/carnithine racemase [Rhizobiales bacterium GAS191]|nr:Enoyl-CoA hydratase/carnithine racemase [Rhizobiales bacterium GAS113]SED78158.1 Enoyl-CoA hydratase/carnithine racemase [Rhizobiales bacterium GAS191]SEE68489.1 Enoyl-CoA hydratase/carnithine racemase [Rhizobiales bacterium GAS188]
MQFVKFERKDAVGHIILANPPKNLINSSFSDSLKQAVHEASEGDLRALLVRAEGPNFSQGGDVLDFLQKDTNAFRTFIGECNQSFRAIEALQIPTVVAVRGAAFGGAFELALACDFIVAAEDAVFRCIEASVGSAPVAGAVQRLAERIGRSRAARYAMLCEPMSGVVAGQLGIAAFVVPAHEVEATALKFAQDLSTGPTRSYAAIRTLLKAWSGGGVPSADAMILDVTMGLHSSEDARRGRTARAEAMKKGIEPPKTVFTGR